MSKQSTEKDFWETISQKIAQRLGWDHPIAWTENKIKELQDDMAIELQQAADKNPLVTRWCKLGSKQSIFDQYSLSSSINRIFVAKAIKTTREFTKNRFTFYLCGQSAEAFKRNLAKTGQADRTNQAGPTAQASSPNGIHVTSPSNATEEQADLSLKKQIEQLIDLFENRTDRIKLDLQNHSPQTNVDSFLKKFEHLHFQHVGALRTLAFLFVSPSLNF